MSNVIVIGVLKVRENTKQRRIYLIDQGNFVLFSLILIAIGKVKEILRSKSVKLRVLMAKMSKIDLLFILWLILYFGLVLFNLDRVPVAWTDEAQLLDPAVNFIRDGVYGTNLYPFETSNYNYLAYLPVIEWVQMINLKLFSPSVFTVRLPMVLFTIGATIFLIALLKRMKMNRWWLIILVFLFLNDVNVYEMIRAARSEMITAFFFLSALYFYIREKWVVAIVSLSFLIMTHPAAWAAALILFLFILSRSKLSSIIYYSVLVILPTIAWLWFVHFDWLSISEQFLGQGKYHGADQGQGNVITNALWYRFWPFWKLQPYMILFHFAALVVAIRALIKKRSFQGMEVELMFFVTEVYWAFMLAPHHRYNVLLVLLILLIFAKNIPELKLNALRRKWSILLAIVFIPLIVFPFVSRNAMGLLERENRDPNLALSWLDNEFDINQKRILITGSTIGHYYSFQDDNVDFFEMIYPQHVQYENYDEYYLLAYEAPEEIAQEVSEIGLKHTKWSKKVFDRIHSRTYYGMKLYKFNDLKSLKEFVKPYDFEY
jgi:hypothetical protein